MPDHPSHKPASEDSTLPHVLIAGAGIGGMLLGILLEKAGIPYQIYERASTVKPLGAVMALNFNILPALEQIGLLEELKAISASGGPFNMYSSTNMELLMRFQFDQDIIGYDLRVFARPLFYNLLLSKIPAEKIHFGKKVVGMEQHDQGIMIRCGDGTTYQGDILIGADGAYSGVRQGLYKIMSDAQILPPEDSLDLSKGYICMVGTTTPLDPRQFPALLKPMGEMNSVICDGTQYSFNTFIVANNCICWGITLQFASLHEKSTHKFVNAGWSPENNDIMIQEVKDFKTPYGTLGDLIDKTPKELISRVFLEDKLFKTWNYGQTVLIGDAAHKFLPAAGQGAVNALQDAIILANKIYECPSRKREDVAAALQEFRDERYEFVRQQYERSKSLARWQFGQTFFERCFRYILFNFIPLSIQAKDVYKTAEYRPLASFLPPPPKRGTIPVLPQKASKKYAAEQAKLAQIESMAIPTPPSIGDV